MFNSFLSLVIYKLANFYAFTERRFSVIQFFMQVSLLHHEFPFNSFSNSWNIGQERRESQKFWNLEIKIAKWIIGNKKHFTKFFKSFLWVNYKKLSDTSFNLLDALPGAIFLDIQECKKHSAVDWSLGFLHGILNFAWHFHNWFAFSVTKNRVQLFRLWFMIHNKVLNFHNWILCHHRPFLWQHKKSKKNTSWFISWKLKSCKMYITWIC